jgi:hypothetical protein
MYLLVCFTAATLRSKFQFSRAAGAGAAPEPDALSAAALQVKSLPWSLPRGSLCRLCRHAAGEVSAPHSGFMKSAGIRPMMSGA